MLVSSAVTGMVILVFAVPLGLMVGSMAASRAITEAELQAAAVASVLSATTEPGPVSEALDSTDSGRRREVVIHMPDGGRIGPGEGWATQQDIERVIARVQPITVEVPGGVTHLRPAPLPEQGTAVIEVYVPREALTAGVGTAWLVLGGLAIAMLVASAVLADRLAAGAVRATRRLAAAAIRLGEGDLAVRVEPSGPPEIATVGTAFNTLADRIQVLLANERELIADLSHRLRTPLTALRLNAEALPDGEARERILTSAINLEREVDAIIQQARQPERGKPVRCELVDVVRERMRIWSALADDQGRRWGLDAPNRPVWVPVSESDVAAAVDALVGNVFRHTPEGTPYHVRVREAGDYVTLTVDDGGPGIAEPEQALRRGASGSSSTGLGMDIARRVAEQAGGRIEVGRGWLGGAGVTLTLRIVSPRPAADPSMAQSVGKSMGRSKRTVRDVAS